MLQVLFFFISIVIGMDGQTPSFCALLVLGAKVIDMQYTPFIVERHQYYRLLAPIMLHASLVHILVIFI